MCGISGFVHPDPYQPVDMGILRRMTDIMRHRGPDGEGFYSGPGAGLGFRRLSIIDLETGDQPLSNENGSLELICNGEIYNYVELRKTLVQKGHFFQTKSDAEVIVHLYEDYGVECLTHLRGMFAFALWDTDKQQLFLARDRLGIKPIHYAVAKDGTLYFASEQKSILISDQIQRDVNAQAFQDLFTFGFILAPKTLFQHIHSVPPGHYVLYKHGKVSISRYWNLSFPEKDNRRADSEDVWVERLREKLKEVVSLHMQSDVPVGAWLSGGIDSSAVVSLMRGFTDIPVHTFSLGFDDSPHFDEVTSQKTLDKFPGFDFPNERVAFNQSHFDFFLKGIWHHEDPTSSGNHATRMLLAQASASRFKVVLTGEGADEVFGGYPWYRFNALLRPFAVLPRSMRRMMLQLTGTLKQRPWSSSVFLAPHKMNLNRYADFLGAFGRENIMDGVLSDQWRNHISDNPNNYLSVTDFDLYDHWHDFEKIQYMETKTRLADYIVRGLDRSTMAYSLEARVPFLDHELVELCTQIPPSLKMKYLKEKYIFRKSMANHLPPEITWRKKRGLAAPNSDWLRSELPEHIKYYFSEPQLRKKGYFKPPIVRQLLNQHREGQGDFSRALMVILSVQIWDDLFIQGCKP
ncbi:MAG: asparagine synthase (glutamine-hydrolyzing) [Desulfobacteraceae bacterium]|nr:MAG: asparagine synthase (glutamine-hydrolyzing) [Desulfobacteraceae bacterium]